MRWVDEALWSRDPEDWEPWQVLGDRLLEVGDVRGQLLLEEADGSINERLAESWLATQADPVVLRLWNLIGVRELLEPLRDLAPVELPALRPVSQVFAAANPAGSVQHLVEGYSNVVLHASLGWIRHAFAAFRTPDDEHLSLSQALAADYYRIVDRNADPPAALPWWELPDEYLIEYAAPICLDEQGMAFYGPALMGLHLRDGFGSPLFDHLPYTEDLSFLLQKRSSEKHFRLFGPEQAAAVAAYGAMLADRTICEIWTRRARAGT